MTVDEFKQIEAKYNEAKAIYNEAVKLTSMLDSYNNGRVVTINCGMSLGDSITIPKDSDDYLEIRKILEARKEACIAKLDKIESLPTDLQDFNLEWEDIEITEDNIETYKELLKRYENFKFDTEGGARDFCLYLFMSNRSLHIKSDTRFYYYIIQILYSRIKYLKDKINEYKNRSEGKDGE